MKKRKKENTSMKVKSFKIEEPLRCVFYILYAIQFYGRELSIKWYYQLCIGNVMQFQPPGNHNL